MKPLSECWRLKLLSVLPSGTEKTKETLTTPVKPKNETKPLLGGSTTTILIIIIIIVGNPIRGNAISTEKNVVVVDCFLSSVRASPFTK